ncbi:MAG: hypothetical protein LAN62_16875 [Acidobacteriia bacterium]|nr:hypothetical protein [Terriglobia bacterium]
MTKPRIALLAAVMLLACTTAFPQASGSFNAAGTNAACAIGEGGSFNGGVGGLSVLTTTVQTSNGQGVTLLIRPSLVTGLFTDTKISTTVPTSSADVGIQVCVTVDGNGDVVKPASCIIYDERFQQVSSNLFSQLAECTQSPTTTTCTADADCASLGTGFTCSIPSGATSGVCVGPNPNCDFDLILSTLSAHSYDFVAQVPNGPHTIRASWSTIGTESGNGNNNSGTSHTESCVGPGILTVTQTKVFQQNGTLSF